MIRKKEFAKADDNEGKNMKHKLFIILSREQNLKDTEKEGLHTLMKQNENLYRGYLLKEQIVNIFEDKKKIHIRANKRTNRNIAVKYTKQQNRRILQRIKHNKKIFTCREY
jgi:formate dehydrogenase assembly factor FdhD